MPGDVAERPEMSRNNQSCTMNLVFLIQCLQVLLGNEFLSGGMPQEGPELSRSCRGDCRLGIGHSNISPDAVPQTLATSDVWRTKYVENEDCKLWTGYWPLEIA